MRNAWDPRTGRTPEYAIWYDELGDVLIQLGLTVDDNIDEEAPEKPAEASYDVDAYNLWADAVRQYQGEGTRVFDAVRGSLIHFGPYTQMDLRTISQMKHKREQGAAALGARVCEHLVAELPDEAD